MPLLMSVAAEPSRPTSSAPELASNDEPLPEGRPRLQRTLRELVEDYRRHSASASELSVLALANYRLGRWAQGKRGVVGRAGGLLYRVGLLAVEAVAGIYLERGTEIGDDVHFVHAGGINIHPDVVIGDRVGIMHGVTLGSSPGSDGVPVIGDDVFIGSNATVMGRVRVGDGARIAANSLVVKDVPAGMLAIGVPAKSVPVPGART